MDDSSKLLFISRPTETHSCGSEIRQRQGDLAKILNESIHSDQQALLLWQDPFRCLRATERNPGTEPTVHETLTSPTWRLTILE